MSFFNGDFIDYMHDRKLHMKTCDNPECKCLECTCDPCVCSEENPCGCDEQRLIKLRGGQTIPFS